MREYNAESPKQGRKRFNSIVKTINIADLGIIYLWSAITQLAFSVFAITLIFLRFVRHNPALSYFLVLSVLTSAFTPDSQHFQLFYLAQRNYLSKATTCLKNIFLQKKVNLCFLFVNEILRTMKILFSVEIFGLENLPETEVTCAMSWHCVVTRQISSKISFLNKNVGIPTTN